MADVIDKSQAAIAALTRQVEELNSKLENLQRNIDSVGIDQRRLTSQINTIVPLFEYRVDQIYGRILELFGQGEFDKIVVNSMFPSALDSRGGGVFGADHISAREGAVFTSPLTMSGFRIRGSAGIERSDGLYVGAGDHTIAVFGPYVSIETGSYRLDVDVEIVMLGSQGAFDFDVYLVNSDLIAARGAVSITESGTYVYGIDFSVPEGLLSTIEFRFWKSPSFSYRINSLTIIPRAGEESSMVDSDEGDDGGDPLDQFWLAKQSEIG